MPSPDNAPEEIRRLRRTTRDLVALSTLPAVWIGRGPDGIARSLADVLLSTLALDLVYVRLTGLAGEGVVEFVRDKHGSDRPDVDSVRSALAPLLGTDQTESPATISDPLGEGTLHVAVTRFGVGDDDDVLVTGSRNTDFPTEQDRVLLGVGANQTAIVLQRRRAEERLHDQQEWLRVTLASIGDAVLATDTEGRVTFLNSVAEELTGWTQGDARGKPLETVFAIANEQTRQPVENPVEKVLREGLTVGLGNHTILLAKGGRERPIDDSAAPIRDATGNMIGVVLIFRDVTEQRRAERELRASEARKSAILETALDCIITMDHEGKVVEFNPAAERTFGYSRAEVVGRQLADFVIPPSLRERHHDGLAHYLATGKGRVLGRRLELPALHADGSEFPVELAITRIPTEGPPLFTAYLRDITERKRTEQHRNTRLAVTQALTQATSIPEGTSGVLQAVCDNLDWDVGFYWMVDDEKHALVCREAWHRADAPVTAFETASCSHAFERGEGLPGRVWATSEPAWLLDVKRDGNFPRAASAAEEGLHSAFACPIVVGDQTVGVIEFFTRHLREPDPDLLEMMATMAGTFGQFVERTQAQERLREQTVVAETLNQIGTILAAELDLGNVVQAVTDEGTRLTSAEFGAFFYNVLDDRGGSYTLYTLSGVPREAFADFPMPRNTAIFGPTFRGEGVVRLDDVTRDPRFGQNAPHHGMPEGHLPVRSYLAVPVVSRSGEVFGGLFFGHSRVGAFTRRHERILVGVAAQAAIAIDNARLYQRTLESEERFRQLAENIEDVFWMVDPHEPRMLFVSPAYERVWGRSRESLYEQPRSFLEAVHPDDRPRALAALERQVRGDSTTEQYRVVRLDGSVRWVLDRAFPIRDATGQVYRIAGIAEDVTERKQVEQDLKLQARVLDSMTEGVSLSDENGIIIYTNPAEDRIFGYEPGELVGQHVGIQNIYSPEENQRILEEVVEHLKRKGVWSGEFRNRRKDGSQFTTHSRITALETGGRRYFVCVQEDVTERKRVEGELQDARSRLDAALEAGAIATWTWDIPNDRLFTDTSLARLFNLSPSEAEGGLLEEYVKSIHPDDWPGVSAALGRSVESGEDYEADYRIMQPDGSVRWVVARGRAERDETGRPVRMPGVLVDITERKRLEEELRVRVEQLADANRHKENLLDSLRESEEKLRLLANTIPQLAWMARPDGHIFWYNRRWYEYTGTTPEQMEGWGWQSVHDPEVLPKVLEQWKAAIESGEPFEMVFPLKGADGRFRPYLTRVNPLKDEEGRILYWFGTNTDIGEIKRMEEALRDADRRKDEFLATLAHELRNPLAPIRTGLEVMKLAKDDPATVEETRNTMERQTEQLITLVDDLLDVSRITRGRLELRKCRVKLSDVTQSAVEASKPFLDEAGHELAVFLPDEPIHLDADPHRLAQVVSNLLNNAAKYTPEGGHIRLAAERYGSDVIVSVADNGIGIPADMLDRIFEMFAQIDRPMEKGDTGLGIGLTLVKSLVEMHGGGIEVRSDGPNRGSEFRVRLPILVETPVEEKKPVQSEETATAENKGRVLVVDDNKAAAEMLSMVVKMLGNEVRTAGDGQQAIDVAAEFLPDVVLMDLGMPRLNGYEAARHIRQQPWGANMVLVALTGWGQDEDKQRTKEAGFDHHLVKPAETAELQRLLDEVKNPPDP